MGKIVEELKIVNETLDRVMLKLRLFQEAKLRKTLTDEDLLEVKSIKEIIAELESVA